MSFSTLGYLFISAMCVIIIVTIIGIIYSGIAERNDRKAAERLEDERKNGDADVIPANIMPAGGAPETQPQQTKQSADVASNEAAFQIKYSDDVSPRYALYRADCQHCCYGINCPRPNCKGCKNAEEIDDEELCHCYDIIRVESKRPQCPYFKDITIIRSCEGKK